MVKAARDPERPKENRDLQETAKSVAQLKSSIDVQGQREALVQAYVKPRMNAIRPAIGAAFALDDDVRLNPQYPNIADPYRTIA